MSSARETNQSLPTPSVRSTNNSLPTTITKFLLAPETNGLSSTKVSNSSSTTRTTNDSLPLPSSYVTSESLVDDEHSLLSVVMIPNDDELVDCFQTNVQIKNQVCGEIQYLFKQTQLFSTNIHTIFNENISMKNFLIETKSSLIKLKQSIFDLIIICDSALDKIPFISTTFDEIKSTEVVVFRDPSTIKVYNELELRYLVDQGPLSVLDDTTSSNIFALTPKTTTSIRLNTKFQSIRSIYESIEEILQALDMITDDHINFDQEYRRQANSISTSIKAFNLFTYLIFMKNLMSMTNSITTKFQAEKLDLITAGELLTQTTKLLETERSNEINLKNIIIISEKMAKKYAIVPQSEFNRKHRRRKPLKRLDDNPQTTYQFTRYVILVK
ncbi:unnamed protein product [Rotaria sp. Silwood2]|nr:unnamed protein product [Rotaria sp. Silwood2]